jgi:putative tricarboxylic transport membrane protein
MRIDDRIFGLLVCLLGAGVLWYSAGFPDVAGQYYGPAMFPSIIGWGFVITGILLSGAAFRRPRAQGVPIISFPDWRGSSRGVARVGLMLASILAFAWLGEPIGFQILAFASLVLLNLSAGYGILKSIAVAFGVTLCFDLLFSQLLKVPLPRGLLTEFPLW